MHSKRFFLRYNFLFLTALAMFADAARAESLSDVYATALQNDFQLKAAQSTYLAGKESAVIGRSGLLPSISAQGVWTRSRTTSRTESNDIFAPESSLVNSNSPGYSISLSQPIINIPALHNYQRGTLAVKLAALQLESARQSLIIRTADAYLQALTAGAKYDAAQSAERAFRIQLKSAKLKYEIGVSRISSYLDAQAAFDSSVADTLSAKNNLESVFDSLKVITGVDHTELSDLSENFIVNSSMSVKFDEWLDSATKNNIEINIAKLKLEDSYQNSKSKSAEHLPKLSAGFSYLNSTDRRSYQTEIPDKTSTHGLTASLTLSIPIYSGGGISASSREASYLYAAQKDNSDGVIREVSQKLHSTYLSVISGMATIEARKAAMTSSQTAYDISRNGYEEGIVDMVNVINAQKNVFQAKLNYADAVHSFLLEGLKLKQVAGSLASVDIEELSRRLDLSKKVSRPD